jgi:hypothetical protein
MLLTFGCGRQALSQEDEAAVRRAVEAYYEARKDSKRQVIGMEISPASEGARVRVRLKFPDFHSVAAEQRLLVRRGAHGWEAHEQP